MANTNCGVNIPTISSAFISKEGHEILSAMKAPRYVNYINVLFGRVFAREYVDNSSYITLSDFTNEGGDQLSINNNLSKLYNLVKQELDKDILSSATDNLRPQVYEDLLKIQQNWPLFIDYHSNYNDYVSIREDEDEEDSEKESKEGSFDKKGNEYSEFDLISAPVQTLFKFFPKADFITDIHGNLKIEEALDPVDGLPIAGDYSNLIKLTLDALKGVKDEDKFIEILTSPDLLKKIPELEFLFRVLPLKDGGLYNLQDKQRHLLNSLYQSFSRDFIKITAATRYVPEDPKDLPDHRRYPAAKGNIDKIERQFVSNFTSNQAQTEYTKTDNSLDEKNPEKSGFGRKRLYSLPKKLDRIELTNEELGKITIAQIQDKYEKYFDFLKVLGIEFSDLSLLTSVTDKEELINILNSILTLHDNISDRLESGRRIYNPISDTDERIKFPKNQKIITVNSTRDIFKAIIKFEAKFSKVAPTVMSRGGSGEKQSDISYSNALSLAAGAISNSNSLGELFNRPYFTKLKYNPLVKYSYVANNIIGTQNKYTIENYSGYTIEDGEDKTNSDTKSLSNVDKFISDFSNLLGWGRINTPQLESKSGYFSLNFINKDEKGIIPFNKENFVNGFTTPGSPFFEQMLGYLRGELDRVRNYPELKRSAYNIPEAYGKLHIFADMISDEQLERLLNEKWDSGSALIQEIRPNIEKYFEDQFNTAQNFIQANNIKGLITKSVLRNNNISDAEGKFEIYKSNPQYYEDLLLKTFLANDFIHNVEFGIFASGDPLFFKDWHKRLGGLASTGIQPANTQNLRLLFAGDRETNYWNNYSLRGILNQYIENSKDVAERRDNFDTFFSAVLQEDTVKDDTAYQSPKMIRDFKHSYYLKTGKVITPGEAERMLNIAKIIEDGIDVGDGQGYLNMDAHRELSIRQDTYRPQHDVSYKYQALIFKRDILGKELSEDEKVLFTKVEAQISREPHKYALPILKQTYYGTLANEGVEMDAKVFDKFSLFPLLPSIAKGNPKLVKLLMAMAERQIHYVKYKSGTKGYVKSVAKNIDDLFNPDFELDELKSELLKLQITPSKEEKTETGLATQMTKLFYTNLFGGEEDTSQRVIDQRDKFISDLNNIQASNRRYVLNKLGFKTDKEGKITSWNREKIVENLIKQINLQKLPSTLIEALRLNSKGEFINTIESSGIFQQLMNYVVGKLDSGLRQFKLNGGDFVLISESMFDQPLKYFKLNKDKTKTEALECRVTLTKEFVKLLDLPDPKNADKTIGTIDRLNQLLKDRSFVKDNQKALTITFSRPPVQGPNSMGVAIIKEFFSPTVGNVLQLPKEFMHQAGIDFDYDKEKVYLPSLSNEGVYLDGESIQKRLEQLEDEYSEFRDIFNNIDDLIEDSEGYMDYSDVKKNLLGSDNFGRIIKAAFKVDDEITTKDILDRIDLIQEKALEYLDLMYANRALNNNKLLQSMIDSVLLPELFSELVLPNTDTTIKPLAKNNGEEINNLNSLPIGNSVYTYMENLKVFKMFNDAKSLLGPFALNNVFSQLIAPLDIKVNLDYNWNEKGEPDGQVNLLLLDRKKEGANDRVINISKREDFSGQNKQHLNSEFINATVDSNKDPYFANFMLSFDNINTFLFLFNVGYPVQTIVDFTSSAIVRKYLDIKNRESDLRPEEAAQKALKEIGIDTSNKLSITQIMKGDASNIGADNSNLLSKLKELKSDSSLKIEANQEMHRALLYNFIAMNIHSRAFSDFKSLFKNDTNKVTSLFEIAAKQLLRNGVERAGMFSDEDIKKVENNSTMTAFRNDDVIKSVLSQIFPIISKGEVVNTLGDIFSNRKPSLNSNDQRILSQVITNDFIGSILFTYGSYKGGSLFEYARDLVRKIKQPDGNFNTTLLQRVYNLKQHRHFEELSQMFPVLNKIAADTTTKPINGNPVYQGSFSYNVLLDIDPGTPLIQKENYMNQFKRMVSGDFEFSDENIKEQLTNLIKDFFIAGLVQTGFNKTGISFVDYMPISFTQELLKPALDFYNFLLKYRQDHHNLFLQGFKDKFKYNNSKYFYFKKDGVVNEKLDIVKSSHLGKALRVLAYDNDAFTNYPSYAEVPTETSIEGANDLENLSFVENPEQLKEAKDTENAINTSTIHPGDVVKTNQFSYKGKTISTEFELGDQQRDTLEKLIDFVKGDDEDLITLQGAAGTGKTSIIGYLAKYLGKDYSFAYMAPTHAATAELAFSTAKTGNKSLPSTLASSLTTDRFSKKSVFTQKVQKKLMYNPVVVLDEASMIDASDIQKLKEAIADIGGKLIFLGDEKQISKVVTGDIKSKQVSPAFTDFSQLNLIKIFRQSNNNLLSLLSAMRDQKDFKLFKVANSDSVKFLDKKAYNKELIADLQNDPENTVVVSYTNNFVKGVNTTARKILGREGHTQVGDIAIGYLGYASKQIEKGDVANSISYTITDISSDGSTRIIYANSAKLEKLMDMGINIITNKVVTKYYQLSPEDSFTFDLSPEDFRNNNRTVSDIFKGIHDANEDYKNKKINYATYLSALAAYSDTLRKVSVGNDYIYNPTTDSMELFDQIKHKNLKSNGQGSLLMNKDIDYGHAITIHKSQGSTINNVYFDTSSLKSAANTPIVDSEGNQITTEKQSLAYVAMSRSKNKLVVYESDNQFEELPEQEEKKEEEKPIEKALENDIYSQLGDKTVSENIEIIPWADLKEYDEPIEKDTDGNIEAIVATRIPGKFNHFGNPFSSDEKVLAKTPSLIKVDSTKEAVEKYIDWVINSQEERAKWIRKQIESGKLQDKPILYYKELGEPSHATALDYLINKYDWSKLINGQYLDIIQPGFGVYRNALTQEEHDKILTYALNQFAQQGYHVKKAVAYAHWGKMWAVNDKGNAGFPVFGKYLRKDENGRINLPIAPITSAESVDNPNAKGWYNYYETDQNGNPLSEIPQEIKDIVKRATGYDITEHDAAIINAYADGTVLTRHIDNTEDTTARGKAIVSINLVNPGTFYFGEGSKNSTNTNPDSKQATLNPKDIAIFGDASRFMPHRVDVGKGGAIHVPLADGTGGIEARRINITIRRVMPVEGKISPKASGKAINIYSTDRNGFEKLSNILNGPIDIQGFIFKTVEHLYQWKKAQFAKDEKSANDIFNSRNGWDAQRAGKSIQGLDSAEWDKVSSQILEDAMRLAFEQNPQTKALLISTAPNELTHKTNFNLGKWQTEFPRILTKLRDEFTSAPIEETETTLYTQPTGENTPNSFVNHSGGAYGADKAGDEIGRKYGFNNHNHYFTGIRDTKNAPYGNVEIRETDPDYQEGRFEAARAAAITYGYQYSAMKDPRLIRNWSQVKYAEAIFAIGKVVNEGERLFPDIPSDTRLAKVVAVTGGTGYAVQMAINHNKPVFVFDQTRDQWYKNVNGVWSKSEVPVLTKNYALIGTRNINDSGIKAINDLYKNTIDNLNKNTISNEEQKNLDEAGFDEGDCKS